VDVAGIFALHLDLIHELVCSISCSQQLTSGKKKIQLGKKVLSEREKELEKLTVARQKEEQTEPILMPIPKVEVSVLIDNLIHLQCDAEFL
jgi:hypothetical protein